MRDTTAQTLRPHQDSDGTYRRLRPDVGEQHRQRTDLLPAAAAEGMGDEEPAAQRPGNDGRDTPGPEPATMGRVAALVHLTDFQLADLASPARVEYAESQADPAWARMRPSYRPQEFLQTHALWNIVRTINTLAREGRWDLAISTGDHIDSMQANELEAYLRLLDGGEVDPAFGTRGFRDAPTLSGDPTFWHPEPGHDNQWSSRYGLPDCPGVLAAARKGLASSGMGMPWIASFGNHDCLVQGRTALPRGWDEFTTADQKPTGPPSDLPTEAAEDVLAAYVRAPGAFTTAPTRSIAADPQRRSVSRAHYMQAHLDAPGQPTGHGFTEQNVREEQAYFVYDEIPGLRVISLDSTNPHGHVDGRIDHTQFHWLRQRLAEVHSQYLDERGNRVPGGGEDRIVVICSHHGTSTMTNDYGQGQVHLAADIEALLHRFPGVVLWLNGHTHINRITAHPRPAGGGGASGDQGTSGGASGGGLGGGGASDGAAAGGGFWEISTSAIAEWPVQVRTLELDTVPATADRPGMLRIRSTMVDSEAPAGPQGTWQTTDLAALHREVAANDPGSVGGLHAEGGPEDRNCDLWLPWPAPPAN